MNIDDLDFIYEEFIEIDETNFHLFTKYYNYKCMKMNIYLEMDEIKDEQMKNRIIEAFKKPLPKADLLCNLYLYTDIFSCIPRMNNFRALKKCHIENPNMNRWTYNFKDNPNLKELIIDAPITFLYRYCLSHNKNLSILKFANFRIQEHVLQRFIENLRGLEEINLNGCNLKTFEMKVLKCSKSLKTISLSKNKLTKIPTFISNCKSLTKLDICHNEIQNMDDCNWIGESNISILCIKNNLLTKLPVNTLVRMKQIKCLNIYNNKFDENEPLVFPKTFLDKVTVHGDYRIITPDKYELFDFLKKNKDEDIVLNTIDLQCPISKHVMIEPVSTVNGYTYEKYCIEKWLRKNNTDPLSGQTLTSKLLVPNLILSSIISDRIQSIKKIEKENPKLSS